MIRAVTPVGTFEVCVPTHAALRIFIMQALASQLHFLTNRNAELAVPPLLWPVNYIKNRGTCGTAEWPYFFAGLCPGYHSNVKYGFQKHCVSLFFRCVQCIQITDPAISNSQSFSPSQE